LVYGSGPRAVWGFSGRLVGAAGGVSPHRRCVPRRCATPWRGPLGGAVRWTAFGELLRWAGRRRGGLGGGRASPAVVFVMSTGGDVGGLSSRSDRARRQGRSPRGPRALAFRACATRRS